MPSIALFSWPIVVLFLFGLLPQRAAIIWSLFWGYLLLPERFGVDLPGLPPLTKISVTALSILLGMLLFRPQKIYRGIGGENRPELENRNYRFGWTFYGLVAGLLIGSALVIAANRAPMIIGDTFLPGLGPRDLISMTSNVVFMIIPFFLGQFFFSQPEDHRFLLRCLVIAGLIYSLFILVELRLSPQMHNWVYGFHQHSFAQHIRGGYRPKVFLQHGIWVGLFLFMVALSAIALARSPEIHNRRKWGFAAGWMILILLASRNLGAVSIFLLLAPLLWMRKQAALTVAMVVTLIFLAYPAARQANLIPVDQVLTMAGRISEARAQSFGFRLKNEDILLEKAARKPITGWGGWGRSRVYNENGRDISTTDGLWIIILGTRGWLGYLCFFGLLTLPLIALRRVQKRKEIPIETLAMAVIMTGNLIYLVPNSALNPIGWLICGALAGFAQFDPKSKSSSPPDQPEPETSPPSTSGQPSYTRFPKPAPV